MKYNTLYSFILAVFLAVALAVSCSKADPESEGEPAPQVYTMTVNASRVYTKALEEDTSDLAQDCVHLDCRRCHNCLD